LKEIYCRTNTKTGETFFWGGSPVIKEFRITVLKDELVDFQARLDKEKINYIDLGFIIFKRTPFVQMPNLKREAWIEALKKSKTLNRSLDDIASELIYKWTTGTIKVVGEA
jgi:hypothetical protein